MTTDNSKDEKPHDKDLTGTVTVTAASSLPVNHFASTILATTTASLSSMSKGFVDPNHVICEGCEEKEATEFCKDCFIAFCGNCKKPHLRPKSMAHHQFISLDEATKPGSGVFVSRLIRCEKHPHLEINTYCHTDRQAICSECAIDHHKGHEVERLAKVVQGFKEEISQLVDKVLLSFFFFLIFHSFSYFFFLPF